MKNLIYLCLSLFCLQFLVGCKEQNTENLEILTPVRNESGQFGYDREMTRAEIDAIILAELRAGREFDWDDASDWMFWSALTIEGQGKAENTALFIGYENEIAKQSLLKTNKFNKVATEDALKAMAVSVTSFEEFQKVRATKGIKYLEPGGYDPEPEGGYSKTNSDFIGCDNGSFSVPPSMFFTSSATHPNIQPANTVIPWNWGNASQNIVSAWDVADGSGVTVAVIDTGVDSRQPLLNGSFVTGMSGGRTHTQIGVFRGDKIWLWPWQSLSNFNPSDTFTQSAAGNDCVHGTMMAGHIAGPRVGGGSTAGIAYKANLISYRASDDVLLNRDGEVWAVSKAIRHAADNPDVKIISMSMGRLSSHSLLESAVLHATNTNSKLFFAAAGTSLEGTNDWAPVLFPSKMWQVMSVTGIKSLAKGDTPDENWQRCSTCHYGSDVDFSIIMQQMSTGDKSLTLKGGNDLNGTSILSPQQVGGSSIATATMAGIAALVWSKNPSWTTGQVQTALYNASWWKDNPSGNYGNGPVDAGLAVGFNPLVANITGTGMIDYSGYFTWGISVQNATAGLSYKWFKDGTQVSTSTSYGGYFSPPPFGRSGFTLSVEVKENGGANRTITASRYVRLWGSGKKE